MQTFSSTTTTNHTTKDTCTNKEYIEKELTTYYIDCCWIKHTKLRAKYALNRMRPRGSQRNLQGVSSSTAQKVVPKTKQSIKRDSWQPKVLAIRRPRQDFWLIDSATDIHVCNDLRLMTDFIKKLTNVRGSTTDRVSPGCGIVWIRLALEDGQEGVILNLWNVFYLLNSPSNLISLSLLNNANIFYDNKHHILYNKISQRPLTFAQRWERSFFLYLLNLSVSATNLFKIEDA